MGTPTSAQGAAPLPPSQAEPVAGDSGRFVSLLLGLAAAWTAAGSLGLIGHALRHALTFLFLGGCFVFGLPSLRGRLLGRVGAATGILVVVTLALSASPHVPIAVLAVSIALAGLAWLNPGARQSPFLIAAAGVFVLGVFRFAITAIPWLWLCVDRVAIAVTALPGWLARQPLRAGATYAGFDFLVLMLTLGGLWVARAPAPRGRAIIRVAGLIAAAHLVYLMTLAFGPKLQGLIPVVPASTEITFGQKAPWEWASALRSLIPWNLPALALLLHLGVAYWLFRTLPGNVTVLSATFVQRFRFPRPTMVAAWVAVALAVPAVTSLNSQRLSLTGKKIVVYEKGFLNWLKPKHGEYGRLSVGMYGMLTEYLQSYGAQCVVSPELAPADLQGAHLLVLIFPNKPWAEGQLERVWNFVREGGSLLVLGEHTVREKEGGNRFNDVLQPTALRVAFDSSMFEIGGWLESYEALHHPATAGVRDFRNDFGVVIGASVEARWPARPVLIGRYGFSDSGDATNDESKGGSMMGNHKYDAGEKLGDQLLAAEQQFGRGRVMVFGDTSGFSNSILFGSHDFVARLYASLCHDSGVTPARMLAGGLGVVMLLGLALAGLGSVVRPGCLLAGALVFSASLGWTISRNHHAIQVLPDGRASTPNRLAYIDTTHLERSSGESWRENGLGGLELTLMRNGYLVLGLNEFSSERLDRAGLLISVAPSRPFSHDEIATVRHFVEGGGIFICTVGWPEAGASRRLLADLGFYVGGIGAATSGQPEPKPFGHFKAPYFNGGDYMAYVRFHAAWHVESTDPQAHALAYGPRDPKGPPDQADPSVILMRRIGRGKVMVVADTEFATNNNLEREGGQPFEGMRENADFWRWLLEYLNDRPPWIPPKPLPPPAAAPEKVTP